MQGLTAGKLKFALGRLPQGVVSFGSVLTVGSARNAARVGIELSEFMLWSIERPVAVGRVATTGYSVDKSFRALSH